VTKIIEIIVINLVIPKVATKLCFVRQTEAVLTPESDISYATVFDIFKCGHTLRSSFCFINRGGFDEDVMLILVLQQSVTKIIYLLKLLVW
jgi:hypothetical protein